MSSFRLVAAAALAALAASPARANQDELAVCGLKAWEKAQVDTEPLRQPGETPTDAWRRLGEQHPIFQPFREAVERCQKLHPPDAPPAEKLHPDPNFDRREAAHVLTGEEKTFDGEIYAVAVHAATKFTKFDSAGPGVQRLLAFAKERRIPRMGLVQNEVSGDVYIPRYNHQFYPAADVDYLVESASGGHDMKFPNARSFLVGGGLLSLCLCEFLRDAIRGTDFDGSRPLKLVLVSDAVFDQNEFGYHGNRFRNLKEFIEAKGEKAMVEILKTYVAGKGASEICWKQNFRFQPAVRGKDFVFRFFKGDRQIDQEGEGPAPVIDIVVASSDELPRLLPRPGDPGAAAPPIPVRQGN